MSFGAYFKKRAVVYGTGSIVAAVLVLGILVVAGLLAERYSLRWDLTRDRSQSLSTVTQNLLTEVKEPLTMTAFFPEGQGQRQQGKELLHMYAHANQLITFTFVDPDRDPLKARDAGYRSPGNILLEYQGRKQMADRPDEEVVSETVRKLLKSERKKVYFLTGHGERGREDGKRTGLQTAKKALGNEGFDVEDLSLLTQADIPKDAAMIVIPGPEKDLFPHEVKALKTYLDQGGRLFVMLEPFKDAGLKEFLAGYGVELNNGIILDQNQLSQALGASAVMPLVIQYGPSRITQDFTNVVTVYPMARPLDLKREGAKATLLPLATTTPSSWEKLGQEWVKDGKANFDPQKDRQGPFTLAVLADITVPPPGGKEAPKEKRAYLLVFGDVDFASNAYFNLSGNGDLFLNAVNFLAEEEKQITIRKDERKPQPLMLTGKQGWIILLSSLVVLPLAMLAAGIRAYVRRRARR